METKKCRKCGEQKTFDCFELRGEGAVKRRVTHICKVCRAAQQKILYQLKKTAPPIPQVCQCCGLDPLENPNLGTMRQKLQLDHDHQTGEFRGWICDNCNVSLSRAGDNLEGVVNLVNYLCTTT